jgi:hypothetical protein
VSTRQPGSDIKGGLPSPGTQNSGGEPAGRSNGTQQVSVPFSLTLDFKRC